MSKKTKKETATIEEQSTAQVEEQSTAQEGEQPTEEPIDKDFDKLAEGLFGTVAADELYFTSDGIAFFSELDAKNHSVGLTDNRVVEVKRK